MNPSPSSIDIEVARALGWTRHEWSRGQHTYSTWIEPGGHWNKGWNEDPLNRQCCAVPPFSQSADACLAHIVPWMRERGYRWFASQCDDGRYQFEFIPKLSLSAQRFFAEADSLPLAICNAFLKAQQQTT